jgi:hypothetical protein
MRGERVFMPEFLTPPRWNLQKEDLPSLVSLVNSLHRLTKKQK